jgi:hypothetical protein
VTARFGGIGAVVVELIVVVDGLVVDEVIVPGWVVVEELVVAGWVVVEEVVVVDDVVVLAGGVSGNALTGSPGLQATSITTSSAGGIHLDAMRLTSPPPSLAESRRTRGQRPDRNPGSLSASPGAGNLELTAGEELLMAATPARLDLSLELRYSRAGGLDASGAAPLQRVPALSVVER